MCRGKERVDRRGLPASPSTQGKPSSWRLACQTNVGDGTNAGSVTVRSKPQQRK